jgi:hypothetical protein
MILLESLRRYPVPAVALLSSWIRSQFLIGRFPPFPFWEALLKKLTFLEFFRSLK